MTKLLSITLLLISFNVFAAKNIQSANLQSQDNLAAAQGDPIHGVDVKLGVSYAVAFENYNGMLSGADVIKNRHKFSRFENNRFYFSSRAYAREFISGIRE